MRPVLFGMNSKFPLVLVFALNMGLGTHGAPEVATGNAILHGQAVLTVGDGSPVGDRENARGRGEDGKELQHKSRQVQHNTPIRFPATHYNISPNPSSPHFSHELTPQHCTKECGNARSGQLKASHQGQAGSDNDHGRAHPALRIVYVLFIAIFYASLLPYRCLRRAVWAANSWASIDVQGVNSSTAPVRLWAYVVAINCPPDRASPSAARTGLRAGRRRPGSVRRSAPRGKETALLLPVAHLGRSAKKMLHSVTGIVCDIFQPLHLLPHLTAQCPRPRHRTWNMFPLDRVVVITPEIAMKGRRRRYFFGPKVIWAKVS